MLTLPRFADNPGGISTALQFILALALLLAAAKFGALLSVRARQPAVLGEILAGVLLGPSVLNLFAQAPFTDPHLPEMLKLLGEVGVLMLMFVAGLEVNPRDLLSQGRPAALAGTLGVLLPIAAGLLLQFFNYPLLESLFVGIVLAATSVSISAQTLLELGRLRTPAGLTMLGAAIIDDVLVIVVLSLFFALTGHSGGGALDSVLVIARMVAFLLIGSWVAFRIVPRILHTAERVRVSEALLSTVLVVLLVLAWLAEVGGAVAAITGAFLAGLGLAQSRLRPRIEAGMHTLSYAFFVPLFLTSIGLNVNARVLTAADLPVALALIAIAILSKLIGCGLGARLGGLDNRTALQVGVGMISRGEVGLIVGAAGVAQGVLDEKLFALSVLVVLAATLVTPPLLRVVFAGQAAAAHAASAHASAPHPASPAPRRGDRPLAPTTSAPLPLRNSAYSAVEKTLTADMPATGPLRLIKSTHATPPRAARRRPRGRPSARRSPSAGGI